MKVKRVLVTGSNRGIGLEFVRQYLEDGWRVYATCRRPSEAQELHHLAEIYSEISLHRLDITVREDVHNIRYELENIPIDILINNAGVYFKKNSSDLDCLHYDDWRRTLEVNTIGTVRITEALLANIELSNSDRVIAALSSHMGSIGDISESSSYYYRSSKAALNAVMQGIAIALKPRNIGVLLLHPGGVLTRMGPSDGIPAHRSVSGMRGIIEDFNIEQSGNFLQYDGQAMVW